MGVEDFDPLVFYESLDNELVRETIESFNRELEELLGGDVRVHYERLLDYARSSRVIKAILVENGVIGVYRGLSDEVRFMDFTGGKRVLYKGGEDGVPVDVERVEGSNLVSINISPRGSDIGRYYIVDLEGNVRLALEGILHSFMMRDNVLYYVRSYRSRSPPDGGETPTDRLVKLVNGGEEVVWGSGVVAGGEAIGVKYSPDLRRALVTVYRGWSKARLYIVNMDTGSWELLEGGDYSVILAGWDRDYVYVRKKPGGDEVVVGGRVFKAERPIHDAVVSGGKLALVELVNASHRVKIYDLETLKPEEVLARERFTALGLDGFKGRFLVLRTSFDKSYSIDVVDNEEVRVVDEGVKVRDVSVLDIWIEGHDGVRLHGFLVSKSGSVKGVIIYGYGGFGVSQTPRYTATFHYLLDLGYALVIPNIRGGGEEGEEWHRAGMLKNKENTFKDYASFAKLFKSLGLKVIGWGASNGGLTVGAVITKWPELIDIAIIGYPVLDMLRFHKLYVGKYWIPEYGDPEDPDMRAYLRSYSPYHNIPKDRMLPPTLVYTGLHDDRVHPAHAIKFTVKARMLGHPVYLRVETRAGHRGAQTQVQLLESAYIVSFIEKMLSKKGN